MWTPEAVLKIVEAIIIGIVACMFIYFVLKD